MDQKYLTHENEVFDTMMKNLDLMIERTIGNMTMRNADEATITLKICVTLDKKTVPADGGGFRQATQPSFKHDLSSVMQVKDKMSGTFKGNVELIFDENGKPIVRDIDDGQMKIWDEDGKVSLDDNTAENDSTTQPTPYDYLMKYRNQAMRCQNNSGTYLVRANTDSSIILSSGYLKESPFYIDGEKLKPHVGENLICVTSPENSEDPDAIEIWCDDCGAYLFGIPNPAHQTEDGLNTPEESGEFDGNENEDYQYDAPEEEESEA